MIYIYYTHKHSLFGIPKNLLMTAEAICQIAKKGVNRVCLSHIGIRGCSGVMCLSPVGTAKGQRPKTNTQIKPCSEILNYMSPK